jgi:serine/threonine protein kinase
VPIGIAGLEEMSLAPGIKLGRYEIRAKIGEGGMGEVYLAEDTRLHRKVALKILPGELSANKQRMWRFEQEAQAAAALNHPNIAHVYEIGEQDGTNFIAMEFVEGKTLLHLLRDREVPLEKFVRYLQQVAEGLAKAHSAGIVHRDLKPENIMIAVDGYAKILDFGLAKLIEPQRFISSTDAALSQNITVPQHSIAGSVMGTVGYMSPEQAQGRVHEIDHRSDIFSFGCILFEVVGGRRAFEGKDAIDALHRIVHGPTPELEQSDSVIPDDLPKIIRRCLAKDREHRYQSMKDVALELEEVRDELRTSDLSADSFRRQARSRASLASRSRTLEGSLLPTAISQPKHRTWRPAPTTLLTIISGLIVVLGIAVAVLLKNRQPGSLNHDSAAARTLSMKLLTTSGRVQNAAVSPDGKFLTYSQVEGSRQSLWTRQIATNSNLQLIGPEARIYSHLTFSPDGNYVYYIARASDEQNGFVYRIPTLGGASVKVLSQVYDSISFSRDGSRVAFFRYDTKTSASSLFIADADGSNEQLLATRSGHEWFASRGAAWSPDATLIACGAGDDREDRQMTMVLIEVRDKTLRNFTKQRWDGIGGAAWTSDGHAIIFSAADRSNATPRQIWQISYHDGEVRRITNDLNSYTDVSLTSDSTTLVAAQTELISTVWISPGSELSDAKQITNGRDDGSAGIAWTPDGRIVYISSASGSTEIWTMKSDGSDQKQLTNDNRSKFGVAVSPDGRYIVFGSDYDGVHLWRINIDGSEPLQLTNGNYDKNPRITPDSQSVIYSSYTSGTLAVWKTSINGGAATQLTNLRSSDPDISRDGKFIACFHNDEQSKAHLIVVPSAGGEPIRKFDVPQSVSFSIGPRWTPDGKGITYVERRGNATSTWLQPLDGKPPRKISDFKEPGIRWRDWSPDGKQMAIVLGAPRSDAVMISNFR